jgi:hypothetical protein
MLASRITPKTIKVCLALHLALLLGLWLPYRFGPVPELGVAHSVAKTLFSCLAYALALALNLEIAAEYRNARWLRVAWLALAGNAALSIARMIVENKLIWAGKEDHPLAGLLQHLAIVPANCFLLIGLLAMWWAYHEIELSVALQWRDTLLIAVILGLMAALLVFREGLTQAQSPYLFSRWLQHAGLVVLSLTAAMSVVLYRLAVQMGGGKLALALQWLTVYVLVRDVLVLLGALLRLSATTRWNQILLGYVLTLGWQSVGWIAALVAAHRAELTVNAGRKLEQQRAARAALASA